MAAKAKPKKVTKCNVSRARVAREAIVEALANPELKTRAAQAKALRFSRKCLWERRREDPTIDQDALVLAKELSAETMAAGLRRLRCIIEGGNDMAAVSAIKFLAQYRGEFVEKREHAGGGGGPIEIAPHLDDEAVERIAQDVLDKRSEKK